VMHERIDAMNNNSISGSGANLLKDHVFQFDFLNDDFSKLPKPLQEIINNPEKRKKLVVYINPPYAEATSAKTVTGTGQNKAGVAKNNKTRELYREKINGGSNEIFALFMVRIYDKIPNSILAQFSKLKFVQGTNFAKFRNFFLAKFLKGFIVKANTFDNVVGNFPIGFTIWDNSNKEKINQIVCDIIDNDGNKSGKKSFYGELPESINKWIKKFDSSNENELGFLCNPSPDFQHNSQLYISIKKGIEHFNFWNFQSDNLIKGCVYFTVRHCIAATWLNDRDQFLYPNKKWEKDKVFPNDCLAFSLFHGQNRISSKEGTNHWIPFSENEVNAREKFESNFMSKFIKGKIKPDDEENLFTVNEPKVHYEVPLKFSPEATAVFDAGRELWKYYHTNFCEVLNFAKVEYNVNASLYDIREHFQGRNDKGRMNSKSNDETYMKLITALRDKLKLLAQKIEPKVYEYGFLKV
ncbi:MAG: hypothetical protein JXR68_08445, partial [Bacteroidales bacterium]|nr:hypothetical protein [Bacteroidales bacterium]